MPEVSDEQLFERYRSGEAAALRALIERYHDPLLRFLTRLVGDRAGADDVFQETFLQIHNSAHTFDVERRFKPWLFTIAANKGRDWLRRNRKRQPLALSAPLPGSGGGEGGRTFVDLMEVEVPQPGERIEASERDRMVQEALDSLSDPLREILLLAYFQRLSYAQIAEDLDIPLGTVKSRLHAAVAAFARAWKRVSGESSPRSGDS
ncbi:MAG: RNA polymerase sigma factor [Phycisphaerales bacterium]|nr:RNA polymerase sigma factor [Phycisphaerales bacterium]